MEIYLGINIKLLPELERPREKAVRYGIETLSSIELLAILIGSGVKGHSAIDIAYNLTSSFKGFQNLVSTSYEHLKDIKGISNVTALKLGATFELIKRLNLTLEDEGETSLNSETIYRKYAKNLNSSGQENFGLILLNGKQKVIREKFLYKGTSNELSVSYFEVVKEVLLSNAKHIYVFHNHPSGDATPSSRDVLFTRGLIHELSKLGVKLIDHVVLGDENYYSFKDGVIYELPK
jgi:DNA repair protein RadC